MTDHQDGSQGNDAELAANAKAGHDAGATSSQVEVGVASTATAIAADDRVASPEPRRDDGTDRWTDAFRRVMGGNAVMSFFAILASLIVGGILIALTNDEVKEAAGYFFARPTDTLKAIWEAVAGAYTALFEGAFFNFGRADDGFGPFIRPLTNTLYYAAPLVVAGLGVAVTFKVGLFNIGGRGQMLVGAAAAGWVGFSFPMPPVVHLIVAVVAGIIGGALWGGIAGFLKARTGAHEVILTIMLNYIAYYLILWMLRTPGLLQAPGSANPISPSTLDTAVFPKLFGDQFNTNWAIIVAIAFVVFAWWLIERSSLGFQYRAVGLNPNAALNAGMNVKSITTTAMLLGGAFMGLAGAMQSLGTVTTGFTAGIDSGIGFDAITVALLGRSSPWGTLAAGLLFGAFKAGGYNMQAAEGVPIDIVLVVQSMIVLFIAAPPLVRAMFGLPKPGKKGARA